MLSLLYPAISTYREIEYTHPELYREATKLLLDLEPEAQTDARFPVDKDRMPGQVLIEVESLTMTLLDHGQARKVKARILNERDTFIQASLTNNITEMETALHKMGFTKCTQIAKKLRSELAGVEIAYRPFAALSLIWENKDAFLTSDNDSFWDLVHVVRAQGRIAHWGESVGGGPIDQKWRQTVQENLTTWEKFNISCRNLLRMFSPTN